MAIAELVGRLVCGLSEADFVRVRCLTTDKAVLADRCLAKNLERAFARHGIASPSQATARVTIEQRIGI